MRRVLRISFGITIRPRSSTRRTMPVAFILLPLLVPYFQWYCLQEMGDYARFPEPSAGCAAYYIIYTNYGRLFSAFPNPVELGTILPTPIQKSGGNQHERTIFKHRIDKRLPGQSDPGRKKHGNRGEISPGRPCFFCLCGGTLCNQGTDGGL